MRYKLWHFSKKLLYFTDFNIATKPFKQKPNTWLHSTVLQLTKTCFYFGYFWNETC